MASGTAIPVSQAYNMDTKVDDGLPVSGMVQAAYLNNNVNNSVTTPINAPSALTDSALTCYNTANYIYSMGYHNGSTPKCALSFRFQ